MTAMISDSMYKHLEVNKIMPWEQKGCAKRSRGTKDQLLIDKSVMRDCRTHKKNLVMGWIDYRKAYDMVPHSWIEEVMGMMGDRRQHKEIYVRQYAKVENKIGI